MPPGIESDAAKWKKVITFVQDSFTERHTAWKKIVSEAFHSGGSWHFTDHVIGS
jgi:hypothetical protein